MRKLKLIGMVLLSLKLQAQQNLVPNGSFEEVTQCPNTISQLYLAQPWLTTIAGSPDLYNECSQPDFYPPDIFIYRQGVPQNSVGFQNAYAGVGYTGIFAYGGQHEQEGREYLQVQLIEPIQSNIDYLVSFWASLADKNQYAVSSLGAYFSDTLITRTEFNSVLDVEPSIENHYDSILDNKDIWHHVTDTFRSRYGGEQYLLIGNFRTAEESNLFFVDSGAGPNWDRSYYYIDDVSVVALGDTVSSIAEAEQLDFSVFPNPNNGVFDIRASTPFANSGTLTLYDMQGRAVLRQKAPPNLPQGEAWYVNASDLRSGIYLLTLEVNGENRLTERLSILKE